MQPGLETRILRSFPSLILAGIVPGAAVALVLDGPARFAALGFALAWMLLLVPLAFGCLLVAAMKGPVRKGRDPYPLIPD